MNHISVTHPPGPVERVKVFRLTLASRLFVAVTVLSALAYLAFLEYLDVVTGAPVMATPTYFLLFYPLVGVSSILMGLTAHTFHLGLARRAVGTDAAAGSSSVASSVVGGVISCSCHTSLLLPLLSSVGLSTIAGIGVISALVVYQSWILAILIITQLYLVYRVLGKIQQRKSGSEGGKHS